MIECRDIHKRFGRLQVLNDVSFRARPGAVTAIIGPNGSGKTTLIKCILGLARPDSGAIAVAGRTLNGTGDYRRAIGYMPQTPRFPENLTGADALKLMSKLRTGSANFSTSAFPFALDRELRTKSRALSGGERQKLNATLALMFQPEILILDEPTAGLDPAASGILKERIQTERARNRTIILTSHIISEVEELADHIVFLLGGVVCFDGALTELLSATGEFRLEPALAALIKRNGRA